jgi:polyisoprenoid-binding protein YceI
MKGWNYKIGRQFCMVIILIALTEILVVQAKSQNVFKVDPSSKMVIEGTSTLHDWTSSVMSYHGQAEINLNQNALPSFGRLGLTIPVESIKSNKSLMDSKTYDALKEKEFPDIQLDLQKVSMMANNLVSASGRLTIAGVTKDVILVAEYKELPGNKIVFTGKKNIKMTDFNVVPPSVMMGAIKA